MRALLIVICSLSVGHKRAASYRYTVYRFRPGPLRSDEEFNEKVTRLYELAGPIPTSLYCDRWWRV